MNASQAQSTNGLQVVEFPHDGVKTYFINAEASQDDMQECMSHVGTLAADWGATITLQILCGHDQPLPGADGPDWPIIKLHGGRCTGNTFSGTQFFAHSGAGLHPVVDGSRKAGYWYETKDARYCLLGDIRSDDRSLTAEAQAYAVFEKMEKLLASAGMDFTDTVRTWFYLRDLLQWYEGFNGVRNRFFRDRGIFNKLVPASTGVGAGSPAGGAVVSALFAIRPKNDGVRVLAVPSPLQCPALDYASAFSRAVEIQQSGSRLLILSGTASIAPDGRTAHAGDTEKQIQLTMKIVREILNSRGMDWNHAARAIAYFKNISDAHLLEKYAMENKLPNLPVTIAPADICREELLFEIELDAVRMD